jgi:2,4-dienoyl-CoA reductase-like NADH-dependent reductase (Old Yellow Enzyme family)
MTGAVGMITSAAQAEHIVFTGQADMVLIAREMLRDPYFPLRAARELEQTIAWPKQYIRSAPKDSPKREPLEKHLATNEHD